MTVASVLYRHVIIREFALSPAAMAVLLLAAMHVIAVLGMMGAHVRMTLTSVLYRHGIIQEFALSTAAMAVLLRAAVYVILVLGMMGGHV